MKSAYAPPESPFRAWRSMLVMNGLPSFPRSLPNFLALHFTNDRSYWREPLGLLLNLIKLTRAAGERCPTMPPLLGATSQRLPGRYYEIAMVNRRRQSLSRYVSCD